MALFPKPKMTEKSLAAQARRSALAQSGRTWTTSRVQWTTVWGSSPERAGYVRIVLFFFP